MSKRDFFKEFKEEIDEVHVLWNGEPAKNNDEREDVILNDEFMYKMARRNGVKV